MERGNDGPCGGETNLNLREGTKRLALLAGVVGAIFGGFASYSELETVINHNRFEAMATSEILKQEGKKYMAEVQQERTIYLEQCSRLKAQMPTITEKDNFRVPLKWQIFSMKIESLTDQTTERLHRIEQIHSQINRGGIKVVHWTDEYVANSINESFPWPQQPQVESIETQVGKAYYPTPKPAAWRYFSIGIFPVIGFFIPWGAVVAIGWVGAGFIRGSR